MQYTSTEMGIKAVDLLLAATRRQTVGIPLRTMLNVLLADKTASQPRMKRRLRHGIRTVLDTYPAEGTVWLAVHAKRYGPGTGKDTVLQSWMDKSTAVVTNLPVPPLEWVMALRDERPTDTIIEDKDTGTVIWKRLSKQANRQPRTHFSWNANGFFRRLRNGDWTS